MKGILIFLVFSTLVIACVACQRTELSEFPLYDGCSVVYATDGEQTLGGANVDLGNPLPRIWFMPGENGDYGRVYVGFHFTGGGMNDQGLLYGGSGARIVYVPRGDKEVGGLALIDRIMRECATVDCAIEYFDAYHLSDFWEGQYLFGDTQGNSVIIEPLTMIRLEGDYQIGTNFYQSEIDGRPPCWRYKKATEMLENNTDISVAFIRDLMDAVHVDATVITTVYDLKEQVIYLYHFHDYDNVVVFNLSEELAQEAHAYEIASLFPENPEWERWAKPLLYQIEHRIESNIDSSISPTIYDAYTGTYTLPDDNEIGVESVSVVADGNSLWLTLPIGVQLEFLPKSETSFFHIRDEIDLMDVLTFDVGQDGKATQFEVAMITHERQSDAILYDLIPILPVETPISVTEDVLVESEMDEGVAQDPLWIALLAGGVILVGSGLAIYLRKRKEEVI